MKFYQHILLATDFSEKSQYTADKALHLAELHNSRITLLHVIEPLPAYALGHLAINIEGEILEVAKKNMDCLAKTLVIPESDKKIEIGSVKNCILNIANKLNVDLIIIGSHGRHDFDFLLGSIATAVSNGSHCDVLIVRNNKPVSLSVENHSHLKI